MSLTEDELLIANELQRQYPDLDRMMATTIVWHSLHGQKIDTTTSKDASEQEQTCVHRQCSAHEQQQDVDRVSTATVSA